MIDLETKRSLISRLGNEIFKCLQKDNCVAPGFSIVAYIPRKPKVEISIGNPSPEIMPLLARECVNVEISGLSTSVESEDFYCITYEMSEECTVYVCVGNLKNCRSLAVAAIMAAAITGYKVDHIIVEAKARRGAFPADMYQNNHVTKLLANYRAGEFRCTK